MLTIHLLVARQRMIGAIPQPSLYAFVAWTGVPLPPRRVYIFFFLPVPPHVLTNFRGFPPGCGDSVADFRGWDAHEAWLRCPG